MQSIEQESHIRSLLEFCNNRRICEKTIDLLISKVAVAMEPIDFKKKKNLPELMDLSLNDLFFYALSEATKKYCDMCQRLMQYVSQQSAYNLIYAWQKMGKRNDRMANLQYHVKELVGQWLETLKGLVNFDTVMIAGHVEIISNVVYLLDTLIS